MESYEQKYKAALEWVRDVYPTLTGASKEDTEHYFPELTESEDERTRKEILDFIQLCLSRTDFGSRSIALRKEDAEMFEKWIAYLEKQKEQKQSEMEKEYVRTLHSLISDFLRGKQEIDREYYQKIWDWLDNRHIEQKPDIELCPHSIKSKSYFVQKPATFNEPYNPDDYEVVLEGNATSLRQKEQKPAEWSEEDERILNEIIETIEATKVEALRDLPNCSVLQESYWVMSHWLKSLPERFNLPPKQEWGEGDEKMIRFYEADYYNQIGDMSMKDVVNMRLEFNNWLTNRLKSIRPQSQWKPSEEQMEVLQNAESLVRANNYPENAKILASLYEQLKKL